MAEIAAGLDPKTREIATALSANPTDVIQGELKGYLEDFIRVTVGSPKNWQPPVGSPLTLMEDLTAQTGEYVYTDEYGVKYLYANGVAVSQATYADLYAFWGPNKWGADAGGNFLLPDCRGRSLFFCGTNAAADLGDNDGQPVANRQAQHSPSIAGLILDAAADNHLHGVNFASGAESVGGQAMTAGAGPTMSTSTHVHQVAGDTDASSDAGSLTGTVGSGMTGDGPAHLFIGSLLVRF